jgi:hypothetical protein
MSLMKELWEHMAKIVSSPQNKKTSKKITKTLKARHSMSQTANTLKIMSTVKSKFSTMAKMKMNTTHRRQKQIALRL